MVVCHVSKVKILGEVECIGRFGERLLRSVTEAERFACGGFKREKTRSAADDQTERTYTKAQ